MEAVGCRLCPRSCGVDRKTAFGACKMGELPVIARAVPHFWEEPCISGTRGSGTVFFSGCALGCVFCQNHKISHENYGKTVSTERLREIFEELVDQGVHNINLVNPTHFIPAVAKALEKPLPVPVVYNSGGYERVESLRVLEGKIQIYLPDLKYCDQRTAARYSKAPDYFRYAAPALDEMLRQVGPYCMGEDGLLRSGVVIRHLILPSNLDNTREVIDYVAEHFSKGSVLFSLMSQYLPLGAAECYPEINRSLTRREAEKMEDYLLASGIEDGFLQERKSAAKEYIPPFDLAGVENPAVSFYRSQNL